MKQIGSKMKLISSKTKIISNKMKLFRSKIEKQEGIPPHNKRNNLKIGSKMKIKRSCGA